MKLKSLLFPAIIFLFAVSCNEQVEIKPLRKPNSAKVVITSLANEPQLERVLDIAGFLPGRGSKNARSNSEGYEIDVNEIFKVIQEDSVHHTYTFKIEDDIPSGFSNLIIEEIPDGTYLAFILTYEFDGRFDFNNYSGSIKRFDLEGILLRTLTFLNGEMLPDESNRQAKESPSSDCLIGVTKHEECLEWGTYYNALGAHETCIRKALVVTLEYGDCSSYEPGTPNDSSPSYGGGTTISAPGSPSPGSTPTDDIDAGNDVQPIPGYKPKKPVAVIPDEWPGSDEGLPNQWWLNDEWLDENFSLSPDDEDYNQLTAEERNLIKQYPGQAYLISKNAEKAQTETRRLFNGVNGLNDKSDAFRHAFFNAMNERDCGKDQNLNSIAKKFSDAHESEVPLPLKLEKDMDLFNNAIGHAVGDVMFPIFVSDNSLSEDVMEKIIDGSLRYLSPLDKIASRPYDLNQDGIQDCLTCLNGIISTTSLTPTNQ